MPAEKLSLSQPNRQSKLEMFQQEVEELFFLQTGAFIVTSWWEVIAGAFKSRSQPVIYSDLLLPTYYAQLCLSRLHQHLSASCRIFQAQYASPSAECC